LTFVVKNCSKRPITQKIPGFLEKPWPELAAKGVPNSGIFSFRARRANGVTEEILASAKAAPLGSKNDLDEVEYELPLQDSETVTVIFAYRLVKYARDANSFFTTIPTESMNFNFVYDQRISLYYMNVHDSAFFDETPANSAGVLNLRSAGPLFPSNGIEFWWAPSRFEGGKQQ
jgi:hypothetical protein